MGGERGLISSSVTAIWASDVDGAWRQLAASDYPAEAALHDLVAEAPQLLPLAGAPQITVLGREVQLGTGRADLVAVESSGRLVIIEVKLAGNSEARRAIVAQVLSYAAYLQGFQPAQLESDALVAHLHERGVETVLAAAEANDQQHAIDPRAFADGLAFWRKVFERRAPRTLPRVEAALGTPLKQGNATRTITDELLDALTAAYHEAAVQPAKP